MFSAWDFNSWIASMGIALFLLAFFTGFAVLVNALICRIWGEERDVAAPTQASERAKESPIRKAA